MFRPIHEQHLTFIYIYIRCSSLVCIRWRERICNIWSLSFGGSDRFLSLRRVEAIVPGANIELI